jgi:hypothetical protein
MSSNLIYDKCNSKHRLIESTNPLKYQTETPLIQRGYVNNPGFSSDTRGVSNDKIDIESDMKNLTRQNSNCPSKQFPFSSLVDTSKTLENKDSDRYLSTNYTRVNRPCNILSGVNIDRFEPLCHNFQDPQTIQSNSYIGLNTRNYQKDSKETTKETTKERVIFKDNGKYCEISKRKGYNLKCKELTPTEASYILPANFRSGTIRKKKYDFPKCDITL